MNYRIRWNYMLEYDLYLVHFPLSPFVHPDDCEYT